jgi:hypothetical protein
MEGGVVGSASLLQAQFFEIWPLFAGDLSQILALLRSGPPAKK